jgi:SAM-dependent methyltransferase
MDASADWWKDFFSGLVVDFWRGALPPEVTRREADFLVSGLALTAGARVLDVPCGHGRLAIELARRGFRVDGVDLSSELLDAARADAAAASLPREIRWRLSDMRDLPWTNELDGAFCMGGSFGYFAGSGDAEFLAAVARALVPGGRVALDASRVAESVLPAFVARREMEKDGIRFESENRYDAARGRIENRYTIRTASGQVETKLASHRVYTVAELSGLLRAAGLEPIAVYGSLDRGPYRPGLPQCFLVGEKARRA